MCTYKVRPDPFARGRLGHVHQAIDCMSGAVVAIEVMGFADPDTALAWYATLDHDMQLIKSMSHPNLLQYMGLTVSEHRIHAVSEHVAGGTLQRLLADMGPLHRSIVPQYVVGLLRGLQQLHMHDLAHGNLSSARIFLGQNGQVKLACYFPTGPTIDLLYQYRVVEGLTSTTRLAHHGTSANAMDDAIARDLRSVLWLMVEMLVGGRVRGIDIDPPRLRQLIMDYPVEQSFLEHVLHLLPELARISVDSAYAILFDHPYLDSQVTWPQLVRAETPQQVRAARAAVELDQCAAVRAELSVAIDSWLHEFETRHHRPPKKKEWPPDVVDMQAQLSALKVHMQDLHDAATHDKTNIFGHTKATNDYRCPSIASTAPFEPTQRRRSTALQSFLHQASTARQVQSTTT
ncbi:serine/threonine protein kinase [Aphanomyces invadans]|uniref:Serine/threonine protein kinase n=1 Tax=Aphanomyces invadans TaxID=157072 RepID=A0A024TFL4_9STRA|nr:serine/threonine protein kinase [Aphanomyces invadans]ETV92804.1 serine/threonine protein kinase [Aphanomyces invadans]|eukprot:XP_008878574.1 serine/threonine protein kinase [Aphanomyces invadans]